MIEELKEQVQIVAKARQAREKAVKAKNLAFTEWADQHKTLLDTFNSTAQQVREAEAKLRELTLQVYEETGNKAPTKGVSVKIFEVLNYDPKVALKWAMTHQIALSLDKKSFEVFAKAAPLDFVTITKEAQATISQDLSGIATTLEVTE